MFSKTIVLSDAFLDMPMSARCLYFTLGMLADDEGFVGNPKSIMRQCGASQDDMAILLQKRYVLGFESGVIVIKHWKLNNYLRNDRFVPTTYIEEKDTLTTDEKGAYTERKDFGIPGGIPSIEKNSIDKNSNNNVDFESEFSKLWERYPKKQGKNSAFTHYKSARKSGVTFEEIEKGLNNYLNYIKANKVEPRYIKNGSTWFNKCWEDSYETIEDGTFKGTAPSYDSEKYRQAAQQPIVYKKRNNKDDVSNGGFNDLVGIF